MRLRGDTLKHLAKQAGVSVEQLAQSVERTGLKGEHALSAVRNWTAGRDHPRCKATDVAKLAAAVGVAPRAIASFTSQVKYHRGSPRKAKLLVDLIRGRNVIEAENLLRFTTKRAAVDVLKALRAAVSDAQLAEADENALFVAESRIDSGPVIKRFQPKDRGRAHPIIKRMGHVTIAVHERA
ncbi:MAG: 50S ribosomal protein L22 [Phycisphaerales bacterium]